MVARVNHVPSLPTATTPPHSRLRTTGRVVVVVGPTAGGKSALALRLAEAMGGEIVNCDALQVRAGLPLLTAKPTADRYLGDAEAIAAKAAAVAAQATAK